MKKLISTLLIIMLLVSFVACDKGNVSTKNLMEGVKKQEIKTEGIKVNSEDVDKISDFALKLYQESYEDNKNILLSPVSIIYALGMTANGAEGATLEQMENVFGLKIEDLNIFLKQYADNLPESDKVKLNLANAIWFRESAAFTVEKDFLQNNADYYDMALYEAAFDEATRKEINSWVKKQTDGMIKDLIAKINPESMMYLINALAFVAEWEEPYKASRVLEREFTTENGQKQKAKLMFSDEYQYLEGETFEGFIKPYKGGKYGFAALLPEEGMSLKDFSESLSGEKLQEILSNPETLNELLCAIPKFKVEDGREISDIVKALGVTDAFDREEANFNALSADTPLHISQILHKTYIEVDEKGTKAAAATAVEMEMASAPAEEPKQVILDRPFIYMIIDLESNLPIFIGALNDLSK